MFLIAMIARVFQPGCKADYMLVLEGPQGALKSTACATLAGAWFSDNLPDLNKSDPIRLSIHLRGKWLIEIAEMSSFNATESHRLKEFITQREERYTPKFGRNEVYEPRQCLFIGTTNQSVYLKDETGGRRFWPVICGTIDLEALARDRDQLLAEAVSLFQSGAHWWPGRGFEAEVIRPQQEARYEADIWERIIRDYLSGRYEVTTLEIANVALQIQVGMIQTATNRRIASILRNLGWVSKHTNKGTVWGQK
jgi:predicted P-loop ATPase